MPKGDRTGPAGLGPMTGRGLGHCGDNNRVTMGFSREPARGFRCFGNGLGRGRDWNNIPDNATWYQSAFPMRVGPRAVELASYEDSEKDYIDREITYLKGELEAMENWRSSLNTDK